MSHVTFVLRVTYWLELSLIITFVHDMTVGVVVLRYKIGIRIINFVDLNGQMESRLIDLFNEQRMN
jgi:hypothetical protein